MSSARRARFVVLSTLTIVAYLFARGAVDLAAASLDARSAAPRRAASIADPPARDPHALACAILARNAFDDATGPIDCDRPDVASTADDDPPADDDGEPATCDVALRLMATWIEPGDDARTLAAIVDATGRARMLARGEPLDDARTLVEIAPERALLRDDDGALCALTLFDHASPRLVSTAPLEAPRAPELRAIDDRHVEIPRAMLASAISDPRAFLGPAVVLPAPGGGLRVYGITRDSPLARIGLANGDVLRALDGRPLDEPDDWLDALARLERGTARTVELADRSGRARTVAIALVD